MTGDERLLADLRREARELAAYQDALALMTVFVEDDGEPSQERIDQILVGYDKQKRAAMVAACRLAWQVFVPLNGLISAMNQRMLDPVDTWRSILEHRAAHGWGDRMDIYPDCRPS